MTKKKTTDPEAACLKLVHLGYCMCDQCIANNQ